MSNKHKILSHDLLLKINFILSNVEKNILVTLDDLQYFSEEKLFIKSGDAFIVFANKEESSLVALFDTEDSIETFKSLNFDINKSKFLIFKNKESYTFHGNKSLLQECVIPMIHYLFYNLLELKGLTERDIYSEKIFSVEYQINLINNLYNLTREQALLYLFSSTKLNNSSLATHIIDVGDISYREPLEIFNNFDVYVFKNKYKDQDDGSYKIDSLNQEWYNASQELLNLINTNHPLIKFREQDNSNIIQFKEWLQHLKVAT